MKDLRARFGWTLKEMSARSGIPVSTLSKVEHDRLTLTYDKLQQLSERLDIPMSDLFSEPDRSDGSKPMLTRRSYGDASDSLHVQTDNYDYHYLCTDIRNKHMIPILVRIRSNSLKSFGDLIKHSGEEFTYVLEGRIVVHTEYYEPVTLEKGEFIYIDSSMGHAYIAADGCEEALVLGMCSSLENGPDGNPPTQL